MRSFQIQTAKALAATALIAAFAIGFQNCEYSGSRRGAEEGTLTPASTSASTPQVLDLTVPEVYTAAETGGNGTPYDGKHYLMYYELGFCPDGSKIFSQIDVLPDGRLQIVRENCHDVHQPPLDMAISALLTQFGYFLYDANTGYSGGSILPYLPARYFISAIRTQKGLAEPENDDHVMQSPNPDSYWTTFQKWTFSPLGENEFAIINTITRHCLQADPADDQEYIRSRPCVANGILPSQRFTVEKTGVIYRIHAVLTGMCLAIKDDSVDDFAKVTYEDCDPEKTNQQFEIGKVDGMGDILAETMAQ